MSFGTTPPRNDYVGNGATSVYPFTFRIFEKTDLRVVKVDLAGNRTVLALNTDYTVPDTDVNVPGGGNVTLTAGTLTTGYTLTIRFYRTPQQQANFRTQKSFMPDTIEDKVDEIVRFIQEYADDIGRALKLPETETETDAKVIIGTVAERASKFLAFDASGQLVMAAGTSANLGPVSAFINTLLDDVDASTARATLGAAPLDSPAFTGTPSLPAGATAVTASLSDNDTSVATTGFVQGVVAAATVAEEAARPRIPVRQTVLDGSRDANGQANWLVIGSGLQINYNATSIPVVLAFANGYDSTGEVDAACRLTADATNQFGTLPASTTSFLYADRASASAIAGANTLLPPQYGDTYDLKQNVLLHFNGSNASTSFIDDYGNTWTANGNAQLTTAQQKFGASSLLLDGTGDYAECAPTLPFTFTQQRYGWTIEGSVRFNVLPTSTQHMTIFDFGQSATVFGMHLFLYNNAGTTKLELYLSSNGTSNDIVSGTVGTNTTWAINTWYHLAITFDPLAGKYYVYKDGGQDISVTSSTNVAQLIKARIGRSIDNTNTDLNGWVDEFRCSPCVRYPNGNAFTPAAAAFTPEGHWFSIGEMKMYEVTAASGVAGTAPTLTNRSARVFVGEADAGAATISAVRSYAYRGRYASPDTACPAAGVRTAFQANLGFFPLIPCEVFLRCYTGELGYSPGMVIRPSDQASGAVWASWVHVESRTVIAYTKGNNSTAWESLNGTTGAGVSPTQANWKMFVVAQRGW